MVRVKAYRQAHDFISARSLYRLISAKGIEASLREAQVNTTSSRLDCRACFHRTHNQAKPLFWSYRTSLSRFPYSVFSKWNLRMLILQLLWPVEDLLWYYRDFFHLPLLLVHQSYQVLSPVISKVLTLSSHPTQPSSTCTSNCPVPKQPQPGTTPGFLKHTFSSFSPLLTEEALLSKLFETKTYSRWLHWLFLPFFTSVALLPRLKRKHW